MTMLWFIYFKWRGRGLWPMLQSTTRGQLWCFSFNVPHLLTYAQKCSYSPVGTWYLWIQFCLHVHSKPEATCPFVLENNMVSQGDSKSHRGVKYISPRLPLLILFLQSFWGGDGCAAFLPIPLSERSSKVQPTSSLSLQLHGGELQLPAHLAKETSWQRRNVLQENFKPATVLQENFKQQPWPHYQTDSFTELQTAQQSLFPFHRTGNKTGLINILG